MDTFVHAMGFTETNQAEQMSINGQRLHSALSTSSECCTIKANCAPGHRGGALRPSKHRRHPGRPLGATRGERPTTTTVVEYLMRPSLTQTTSSGPQNSREQSQPGRGRSSYGSWVARKGSRTPSLIRHSRLAGNTATGGQATFSAEQQRLEENADGGQWTGEGKLRIMKQRNHKLRRFKSVLSLVPFNGAVQLIHGKQLSSTEEDEGFAFHKAVTENMTLKESRPLKDLSGPVDGSTRVITIVFIALLIDLLGFTLILPLLPSILDHYSKNDDGFYMTLQHGVEWFTKAVGVPAEKKYHSVLFGGLIGSIFSILQFLASPLTGAASDYFGRRPVMLLTVIGLIASYFLWAISKSFELFLFSRVIGGISKGNVGLSTAIIADLPCPKVRSKGMAMIGVAFSLGFTLGPMLGAYLTMETEKREIFYVRSATFAVMFAVTDLAFIFIFLPETLPKEKRVSSMICGFQSAVSLINPWVLFQFSAIRQGMETPLKKSKFLSFLL
ncbi:Major facilitator superfamily domain-containing protein 10 [Varanus komodoensis]|nr:Major facilitator superfamily domain-containing protein 10 [Varanus komodoensis]